VTGASAVDVYYDPFDFAIDDDPYPTWKRLRDEAPLYYNEKFDFYALSRYEDVSRELPNFETYRSGRGILDGHPGAGWDFLLHRRRLACRKTSSPK